MLVLLMFCLSCLQCLSSCKCIVCPTAVLPLFAYWQKQLTAAPVCYLEISTGISLVSKQKYDHSCSIFVK